MIPYSHATISTTADDSQQDDSGNNTGRSVTHDQQCDKCKRWFKHVKKHVRFFKQTPDKSLEEDAVGISNQEGGNTEIEPSQVTNHSA